jgi:tape measure domain-containing protein
MEDGDVSMSSVDNRVVELQFNNQEFEANVATSMNTLDKLKKKLKIGDSEDIENLNEVFETLGNSTLGDVATSVASLADRFSTLGIIGMAAISRLTNAAIDLGSTLANALTVDPIKDGLAEYETQIGSIQTILANTSSKGTDLYEVNEALNELNTYADKTIYNFTQMTQNIGRFTAAGVDLDTSVSAIQGIANLAAVSGSTATQASTAMYQLSQAIAAGKVQLMDWNSVVNAGMGGEVFQNALIRTSEHLQTGAKAAIEAEGSFRESLTSTGWLTTEVLTETLKQFALSVDTAEDYNSAIASLVESGYTQEEATEIADMAKTASDAATKVKTFSQLIDTLKEALGSGWTSSWELIFGDYNEAKELWTSVSDSLGTLINDSATSRNDFFTRALSSGWKQLLHEGIPSEKLFAETTKEVARDYGIAIDDILAANDNSLSKSLTTGWANSLVMTEALSRFTEQVNNMSDAELEAAGITATQRIELNNFNDAVANGTINMQDYVDKFTELSGRENVINGIGTAFQSLQKIFSTVKDSFTKIFPPMTATDLYNITVKFKELCDQLQPTETALSEIGRIADGVFSAIKIGVEVLKTFLSGLKKVVTEGLSPLWDVLKKLALTLSDWISGLASSLDLSPITTFFDTLTSVLKGDLQGVIDTLSPVVTSLWDLATIIGQIGWGALEEIIKLLGQVFDKIRESGTIPTIITDIANAIAFIANIIGTNLKSAFDWLSQNISLVDIFRAAKLSGFLAELEKINSFIDPFVKLIKETFGGEIKDKIDDWTKSLSKMCTSIGESLKTMTSLVPVTSVLLIAASILTLSIALEKISNLSLPGIAKGVGTIIAVSKILATSLDNILTIFDKSKNKIQKFKSYGAQLLGMLVMVYSVKKLADALVEIAELSWDQIAGGLAGLYGCMEILTKGFTKIMEAKGYVDKAQILETIVLAGSMYIMGSTLKKLADIPFDQMLTALGAVGGCMFILYEGFKGVTTVKGYIDKGQILETIALAGSMYIMGGAIEKLAGFSWEELGGAVVAMGACMGELVGGLYVLNKYSGTDINSLLTGLGIAAAAFACIEIAKSIDKLAKYSWDQMEPAMTSMGFTLLALCGAICGIEYAAAGENLAGILSGAGLAIASQSLLPIAENLGKLASYSWDQMEIASYGLLETLSGLVLIMGVTGLTNLSSFIGALDLNVAVNTLGTVADALVKLTGYTWNEMDVAVSGLIDTLMELAAVTGIDGLMGLYSILGTLNLDSAVELLDPIANAIAKLAKYSWDQIQPAVQAFGGVLGSLSAVEIIRGLGTLGGLTTALQDKTFISTLNSLGDIADALAKLTPYSQEDLSKGATAIFEALVSVASAESIHGLSSLGGLTEILSADKYVAVISQMGTVADALIALSGYTEEDLSKGAEAIKNACTKVAEATQSYSDILTGLGADNFVTVSSGIGAFAEGVAKFKGINIPSDLGTRLSEIGWGIRSWTFTDWASNSIATMAGSMGTLAEGVKAWKTVTVPDNLGDNLQKLASGIFKFTFAGAGAGTISTVAEPLGNLAESAKKWTGIDIPDDLSGNLRKLAEGVEKFTFAGIGADGISAVVDPLASLADTINKFSQISISSTAWELVQGDGGQGQGFLSKLSGCVQSFTFDGAGADAIASIAEPLGNLADSLSKWQDVDFESINGEVIEAVMASLSTGLQKFEGAAAGVQVAKNLAEPMSQITEALNTLTALEPQTVLDKLTDFITKMNEGFPELTSTVADDINGWATTVSESLANVNTIISDNTTTLTTEFSTLTTTLSTTLEGIATSASNQVGSITESFNSIVSASESLSSGFSSNLESANSTLSDELADMITNITGSEQTFYDSGSLLTGKFSDGIWSNRDAPNDRAKEVGLEAGQSFGSDGARDAAYETGKYISAGLADGITAGKSSVISAATAVAAAAIKAANDEAGVASPSKKTYATARFCILGALNGIRDNKDKLISAYGSLMADSVAAMDTLSNDMSSKLSPTITPVVDISNASTTFRALRTMIPAHELASFSTNFKAQTVSAAFRGRAEVEASYQKSIIDSNSKTAAAITSLKDDLSAYTTAVANSETAMYVDGNKLASSIVKPMNKQLGILSKRNR